MRSLIAVASLAALFAILNTCSSIAASASKANASYASSHAPQLAGEEPVPANCIRQSCGKLWCWNMSGSKK